MKTAQKRLCIYPKDVMRITGRSDRYSRELLYRVRASLNKTGHQFLTVEEFCQYTGLDFQKVMEMIRD